MRGNLVWDIYAFVPSKAGLTKEVVFHESDLTRGWSLKRGTTAHTCKLNLLAVTEQRTHIPTHPTYQNCVYCIV